MSEDRFARHRVGRRERPDKHRETVDAHPGFRGRMQRQMQHVNPFAAASRCRCTASVISPPVSGAEGFAFDSRRVHHE